MYRRGSEGQPLEAEHITSVVVNAMINTSTILERSGQVTSLSDEAAQRELTAAEELKVLLQQRIDQLSAKLAAE